jgi:hypothetical protein
MMRLLWLVALFALPVNFAGAQTYPTKPVRLAVPYAPARVADIERDLNTRQPVVRAAGLRAE